MSEFTQANVEEIRVRCRDNLASLSQAFNEQFGTDYRLEASELSPLDLTALSEALKVPGLVLVLQVGSTGMLSLIPEPLLADGSYKNPDGNQSSQLGALATAWAEALLPDTLMPEQTDALAVDQLIAEVEHSSPLNWAGCLKLSVFDASATRTRKNKTGADVDTPSPDDESSEREAGELSAGETNPLGNIFLIWPVQNPPLPLIASLDPDGESVGGESQLGTECSPHQDDRFANHIEQLKKLPVRAIVRLAEKRVPIARLTELSPGVLLMFEKSCEELLDLYVNNQLFGRGEAVKIGEKFGLKINEIQSQVVRKEKVIYG